MADDFRFCGQDEDHDPGEEFEEYMACAVCGDNGEFKMQKEINLRNDIPGQLKLTEMQRIGNVPDTPTVLVQKKVINPDVIYLFEKIDFTNFRQKTAVGDVQTACTTPLSQMQMNGLPHAAGHQLINLRGTYFLHNEDQRNQAPTLSSIP